MEGWAFAVKLTSTSGNLCGSKTDYRRMFRCRSREKCTCSFNVRGRYVSRYSPIDLRNVQQLILCHLIWEAGLWGLRMLGDFFDAYSRKNGDFPTAQEILKKPIRLSRIHDLRTFSQMSNFYRISDPFSKSLRFKAGEEWWDPKLVFQIRHGQLKPPMPITFRGYMGSYLSDFLWGSLVGFKCISRKTCGLLKDKEFRGWDTYKIQLLDKKGTYITGYEGFANKGLLLDWDKSKSKLITTSSNYPDYKPRKFYKGIFFDEAQWDESDFFFVDFYEVVTKRVYEAFKKAKISNVKFTPLEEIERDY